MRCSELCRCAVVANHVLNVGSPLLVFRYGAPNWALPWLSRQEQSDSNVTVGVVAVRTILKALTAIPQWSFQQERVSQNRAGLGYFFQYWRNSCLAPVFSLIH
jgi:hypothetical protein